MYMQDKLLSWCVTFSSFGIGLILASFIGENNSKMTYYGVGLLLLGFLLTIIYFRVGNNNE